MFIQSTRIGKRGLFSDLQHEVIRQRGYCKDNIEVILEEFIRFANLIGG